MFFRTSFLFFKLSRIVLFACSFKLLGDGKPVNPQQLSVGSSWVLKGFINPKSYSNESFLDLIKPYLSDKQLSFVNSIIEKDKLPNYCRTIILNLIRIDTLFVKPKLKDRPLVNCLINFIYTSHNFEIKFNELISIFKKIKDLTVINLPNTELCKKEISTYLFSLSNNMRSKIIDQGNNKLQKNFNHFNESVQLICKSIIQILMYLDWDLNDRITYLFSLIGLIHENVALKVSLNGVTEHFALTKDLKTPLSSSSYQNYLTIISEFFSSELPKVFSEKLNLDNLLDSGFSLNRNSFNKSGPNGSNSVKTSHLDALAIVNDTTLFNNMSRYCNFLGNTTFMTTIQNLANFNIESNQIVFHSRIQPFIENGDKLRVIAIVDYFTQCLMVPLHIILTSLTRYLESDYVYRQVDFLNDIKGIDLNLYKFKYSLDLERATTQIHSDLFSSIVDQIKPGLGSLWKDLVLDRDFVYLDKNKSSIFFKYSGGCPMGIISSFPLLNLFSHFLCRLIIQESTLLNNGIQVKYFVCGDDILLLSTCDIQGVINKIVEELRLSINESKSLMNDNGKFEFLKNLFVNNSQVTILKPKLLIKVEKSPEVIPIIFSNYLSFINPNIINLQNILNIFYNWYPNHKASHNDKLVMLLFLQKVLPLSTISSELSKLRVKYNNMEHIISLDDFNYLTKLFIPFKIVKTIQMDKLDRTKYVIHAIFNTYHSVQSFNVNQIAIKGFNVDGYQYHPFFKILLGLGTPQIIELFKTEIIFTMSKYNHQVEEGYNYLIGKSIYEIDYILSHDYFFVDLDDYYIDSYGKYINSVLDELRNKWHQESLKNKQIQRDKITSLKAVEGVISIKQPNLGDFLE